MPRVAALRRSVRGKGGRPPFDSVLLFKILVLQALYSLSDEAAEFQIKDRLLFQRFLGLGLDGTVPDATVGLFRERLVTAKAIDKLFARFGAALKDRGYLAMSGQIIDAVTQECLRAVSDTSISGRRVVRKLTDLIAERCKPGMIVSDNRTELTSNAVLAW